MKRKSTLSLIAACTAFAMSSQVVLIEEFNSPFSPAAAGWAVNNLSNPVGGTTWFQGSGNNFPAYSGGSADYYAANFNNAATAGGGISNWLITPTLTIYNGAVVQFATRTADQGTGQLNFRPDRLQLRMSQVTTTTIPTGSTSVGNFTTLLLDINPNLNTNTVTAVNNGSVDGYPKAWTVYSVAITGVTGTVTGRFAFRYYVDNAGNAGTNSNYIGVDAFKYTLPCGPTVNSFTTCAGVQTTLTALDGLPATSYSWSSGGSSSVEVVSPVSTTVYTLTPFVNGGPCPSDVTATVTIGSQLSMSVSANDQTVCAGTTVTLTAAAAATTYSWVGIGATPVVTVAPNTTTTYSVGGLSNGTGGPCVGGNTIQIVTLPNPTISVTPNPTVLCPAAGATLTGTGASTFVWVSGGNVVSGNPLSVTNPSNVAGGAYTLGVIGVATNGCTDVGILTLTVSPAPTLSVSLPNGIQCVKQSPKITATGANTYTWTAAISSTAGVATYSNGTSAGTKTITVAGTSTTTGCTATTSITYSVALCTGIENINGNSLESSVYPNPFSNELKLNGLAGRIEIYNALGQLVISGSVSETETIYTAELPKGAYILKAYTNESGIRTIRLLKN